MLEIHVPSSACSITCSKSNCIVYVCNSTSLHASDLLGRYIYIYMINMNVIYILAMRIYYINPFVVNKPSWVLLEAVVTLPSQLLYPSSFNVSYCKHQMVYGISISYFLCLPEASVSGCGD